MLMSMLAQITQITQAKYKQIHEANKQELYGYMNLYVIYCTYRNWRRMMIHGYCFAI